MTLKDDAKFKGKLTRGLKNDITNLVNFHASSWKSNNFHFDGLFCRKHIKFWKKKYRTLISLDTGEWCKFWRKTGSWFQKWRDEFDFKMSSGKSKNLHFDVLILLRAYKVSAKKMEKGYLSWHWRVIQTLKKNPLFIWKMM